MLTTCKAKKKFCLFTVACQATCQISARWHKHATADTSVPKEVTHGFARLIQHKASYKTKNESHSVIYNLLEFYRCLSSRCMFVGVHAVAAAGTERGTSDTASRVCPAAMAPTLLVQVPLPGNSSVEGKV